MIEVNSKQLGHCKLISRKFSFRLSRFKLTLRKVDGWVSSIVSVNKLSFNESFFDGYNSMRGNSYLNNCF